MPDITRKLSNSKFFSKLDLSRGYWQVLVAREDIPKTAFITPDGAYELLKMTFGHVNSGATLVRGMGEILSGMENVTFYVDDVLGHTSTWKEHLQVLREVLRRLNKAGTTKREVRSFFALTGFYRDYALVARGNQQELMFKVTCKTLKSIGMNFSHLSNTYVLTQARHLLKGHCGEESRRGQAQAITSERWLLSRRSQSYYLSCSMLRHQFSKRCTHLLLVLRAV